MERVTISKAKELFGDRFIGSEELKPLFERMGLEKYDFLVPEIQYSLSELEECANQYILILGIRNIGLTDLSVQTFRECFGFDSEKSEPCFYNQDWYLNEKFIKSTLDNKWYLLKENILEDSRALLPVELINRNIIFPSLILCTYTFFAYYYASKKILWPYDFVWCSDVDHNDDRIYVGKYYDVCRLNKNGFSIHRHLALKSYYGAINCL